MNMIILLVGIAAEIILASAFLWGVRHEKKLVAFEDKIIRFVIKLYRRLKFRIKSGLYEVARNTFIFFYRPYRRMKKRILKRLLRQFGLCAVRCEQVRGYEVLSR